jgi:uncharacterized protein YjbI with pentapeptide repeats
MARLTLQEVLLKLSDHMGWLANEAGYLRANFEGADLSGLDLSMNNFDGAMFWHANLSGCDLSNCNLSGAEFLGANLRAANLRGANLKGAWFERTDLTLADLRDCKIDANCEFGIERSVTDGLITTH